MSFSKIAGQERVRSLLKADLSSGRIAESYIFSGTDKEGQKLAAIEFFKAVNCANSKLNEPCDTCVSCKKADHGVHPDFFILNFESQIQLLGLDEEDAAKQKELKIEAVRILIQQSYRTPGECNKKFIVIEPAELLSLESANSLLKVLEESPKHACWILLTSNFDKVIPTIRSRCRKVSFAFLQTIPAADEDSLELQNLAKSLAQDGIKNPIETSAQFLEKVKRGNQRRETEKFLKMAAFEISSQLKESPTLKYVENLELVLRSQEELRRNVSPQLILDTLFLSFNQ